MNEYTQTLNDFQEKRSLDWTEEDIRRIIAGYRTQRERWNAEQALGSRKLVKSSKIPVDNSTPNTTTTKAPTLKQLVKGIKL